MSSDTKYSEGVRHYDNGKYVGEFYDGIREGKGIFYYNNGEKYDGDWKNGKIEGKGSYTYKSVNMMENGKMEIWKELVYFIIKMVINM